MNTIIIGIHVLVCILLIVLVLLQAGKGSGMGSSLGGSSQALFDAKGASGILGKATTIVAIIFMLTCLTMGYTRSRGASSIIKCKTNLIVKPSENDETNCMVSEHTEASTGISDVKVD